MNKSIENMIKKVSDSFCTNLTPIASVGREERVIYDCIKLENTEGKCVYICEADNDLIVCNNNLECEFIVWDSSNKTMVEKAITLTMGLMQYKL